MTQVVSTMIYKMFGNGLWGVGTAYNLVLDSADPADLHRRDCSAQEERGGLQLKRQ